MDLREIIETPVSKLGIVLKKVMMFIMWMIPSVMVMMMTMVAIVQVDQVEKSELVTGAREKH